MLSAWYWPIIVFMSQYVDLWERGRAIPVLERRPPRTVAATIYEDRTSHQYLEPGRRQARGCRMPVVTSYPRDSNSSCGCCDTSKDQSDCIPDQSTWWWYSRGQSLHGRHLLKANEQVKASPSPHLCAHIHSDSWTNWWTAHMHRNPPVQFSTLCLCPAQCMTLPSRSVNIWWQPEHTCTNCIPPASLRGEARACPCAPQLSRGCLRRGSSSPCRGCLLWISWYHHLTTCNFYWLWTER